MKSFVGILAALALVGALILLRSLPDLLLGSIGGLR